MSSLPKPQPAPGDAPSTSLLTREPMLLLTFVLLTVYFGRSILIPLALALTLNFLLGPAVALLQRTRLPRAPATLTVIAAATVLFGAVLWLVAGQLLTVVNELPNHSDNIRAKLAFTHVPTDSRIGKAIVSLEALSQEISGGTPEVVLPPSTAAPAHGSRRLRGETARPSADDAVPVATLGTLVTPGQQPAPVVVVEPPVSEGAYLRALLVPVLGPLGTAGMVIVFTIYMLLKREDLRNRLLLLAGIGRLNLMTQALDDAAERISRYLIANVSVNATTGVVFGVGLYAIGVPNATLWGALLGMLRMVPYLGPVVGGLLPTVFALIIFPTWWQAFCVIGLIVVLELILANFLEPWLYGAHTGISALALLVMAIVWTLLWGWAGLALSTPLTVCLIVTGRVLPHMSFLHILLGDDAELAPHAQFYERLLALDQAEAQAVAERFLARHSPVELYDQVVLPALGMEEQDRHKGLLTEERAQFLLQSAQELVAELVAELTPEPTPELNPELNPGPTSGLTPQPTPGMTSWPPPDAAGLSPRSPSPSPRDPALFPGAPGLSPGGASLSPGDSLGAAPAATPAPINTHIRERLCPVVCVPTSDQADEIAATMLAQLLERAGHKTLLLPAAALSPELLARFAEDPSMTLCLSAVPPLAFVPARTLCARLRKELPDNRILVGLWGAPSTPETLRARFGAAEPDDVVHTFAAAIESCAGRGSNAQSGDVFARTGAVRAIISAPSDSPPIR